MLKMLKKNVNSAIVLQMKFMIQTRCLKINVNNKLQQVRRIDSFSMVDVLSFEFISEIILSWAH